MMALVTVDLNGKMVPFRFNNTGGLDISLRQIIFGKEYRLPTLPADYVFGPILDIGAHVGAAALWFLSIAPDARVLCFEPAAENFRDLVHNLQEFPKAEAHHCGLFSREQTAELRLGVCQSMQNSIIANSETGTTTEAITLKRASAEFDRLGLNHLSILKIDTEGCEWAILEDLGERLAQVDMIFLEWHSEQARLRIDAFLAKWFLLAHGQSLIPHRGNACYLSKALSSRIPDNEARRIDVPMDAERDFAALP